MSCDGIPLMIAGVLALAVMSLLYRRHRRQMLLRGHTRLTTQTQRRNRGKLEVDLGQEPEMWEVDVGERDGVKDFAGWQVRSPRLAELTVASVNISASE